MIIAVRYHMRIFVASFGTFRRLFVIRPFIVQTTQLIYALDSFFSNYLVPNDQSVQDRLVYEAFLRSARKRLEVEKRILREEQVPPMDDTDRNDFSCPRVPNGYIPCES